MAEDRRITRTKDSIKITLIKMLRDAPLKNISVTELTKNANISRKTFYLHYKSIFDAAEDIDNDIVILIETLINDFPLEVTELDMLNLFKNLNNILEKNTYLLDYFSRNSHHSTVYKRVKELLKNTVILRIEERVSDSNYCEYVSEFLVGGMLSAYVTWNLNKQDISVEELNGILAQFCSFAFDMMK